MSKRPAGFAVAIACVALGLAFGAAAADPGWFPFVPAADSQPAEFDLRSLNERFAGEHGPIGAREGHFIRNGDGQPVRFWAVNGTGQNDAPEKNPGRLARTARFLAGRGVNLVRLHGAVFDREGRPDAQRVARIRTEIAALKAEGIYSLCSIYFPLWLEPKPDNPWLPGYDGHKHPFAALFVNREFQAQYRRWWEALLLTPGPDGHRLVDDPAVMGLEVQNEDSLFFWTFSDRNLPEPLLALFEERFGAWAVAQHGSIAAALDRWGTKPGPHPRDVPAAGRLGLRPLWNLANERTLRDQDTVAFLRELQSSFYRETIAWLRSLGFRGVITASNWTTADNRVLGPLEKLTYTEGDFLDRHGYFSCASKGENSEWSIRVGHTYRDRSALRFDAEEAGKPRSYVHPAMEITYDGKPSMLSESTWNRPNRYRSEAPLYFAVYGALQDTDAIAHFALDGGEWSVQPGFFMQPWTLAAPSQLGQFPAAALIFRRGLVRPGAVLASLNLGREDLRRLQGTPLPQDAAFDELRAKDVPVGVEIKTGQTLDPLLHFAGRAEVRFVDGKSSHRLEDLRPYVDRTAQTVQSTTGEVRLNYGAGTMTLNAPAAQGASGNLQAAGRIKLRDLEMESALDLAHMVVVSLDGAPLAESHRMLLQVMTEERPTGWSTEPAEKGQQRIKSLGKNPWEVRETAGRVRFLGAQAGSCVFTPLDLNGHPSGPAVAGPELRLNPRTLYYLVTRP